MAQLPAALGELCCVSSQRQVRRGNGHIILGAEVSFALPPVPLGTSSWQLEAFLCAYIYIIYLFICLFGFLAVLGVHCCAGFSRAALSRGSPAGVLCRLLTAVASLAEHRL